MTNRIDAHLALEGDDLVIRHHQDAQDIADRAKMLREQPNRGDFHHKWSLPNALVVDFYNKYCGEVNGAVKNMDAEFWAWVDKLMQDPAYKVFWCHDPQHQGRVGYGG